LKNKIDKLAKNREKYFKKRVREGYIVIDRLLDGDKEG
jgi:hypothetical protein